MAGETGDKAKKNQKRDMRERSLMCSRKGLYCICSYTSYITNIYVDVGKLPNHLKLLVLYLCALNQLLFCFIIQSVSNGLRIIMAKVYLQFYKCYILSSSNWRRLWGLHFKFWRCDASVHQSVQGGSEFITEIQPTATDNIFAHYGRLKKKKGKETYWCTCCPIKSQFGLSFM
jgi:hypothetical protein